MGSPVSEEDRDEYMELQVEVDLSQPFWMAKTEVTQEQFEAVVGSNPSHFLGAKLPAENVCWEDAQAFIAKLNESKLLPEGWKFALPTEAQWEYACRAGGKGPYPGGSLNEVGWYDENSDEKTHEVGQKKPNAWGLFDMHGNVFEWCSDWYGDYPNGAVSDPRGPEEGSGRVVRGGSWLLDAGYCMSAKRGSNASSSWYFNFGFRVALSSSENP